MSQMNLTTANTEHFYDDDCDGTGGDSCAEDNAYFADLFDRVAKKRL